MAVFVHGISLWKYTYFEIWKLLQSEREIISGNPCQVINNIFHGETQRKMKSHKIQKAKALKEPSVL